MAGFSILVVRGSADEFRSMQNVCRHRGAQVCEPMSGNAKRFYCRYHAWTYHLDGSLARWRHMPEGLCKSEFGLVACGIAVFECMIFISLDPEHAPRSDAISAELQRHWACYDLAACDLAAQETYVLNANWKLAIENNLECYNCLASHPAFISVNAFVRHDEETSEDSAECFARFRVNLGKKTEAAGSIADRTGFRMVDEQLCRASVSPLAPGFATGSPDGKPVAPLLGTVKQYDETVTTGCIGFHSYLLATSDYAVSITYVPQSAELSHVVAKWFVRGGAKPGIDYNLAELLRLWNETTLQDKDIIELNARGMATRGYRAGPYSKLEGMTQDFVQRYLALLS